MRGRVLVAACSLAFIAPGCLNTGPCGGYDSATWTEAGLYNETAAFADPMTQSFPFSHPPRPDAVLTRAVRSGSRGHALFDFELKEPGEVSAGVPATMGERDLRAWFGEFLQNVTGAPADHEARWESDFLASRSVSRNGEWTQYHVLIEGPWRFDSLYLARNWRPTESLGVRELHEETNDTRPFGGSPWTLQFVLPTHTVSGDAAIVKVDSADHAGATLPAWTWNLTAAQSSVDETLHAAGVRRHAIEGLEWPQAIC